MLRSVGTRSTVPHTLSIFDSCHRKIRLIGGGPVAFLGGLVAKARRKEREGEPAGDPKLYLQEALLERKLPELDMRQLVELPRGLDYNEWLASHSQYTPKHYARNNQPFTSGSPPPLLA
ncbi:PREDICTED: uncharacterized protein LOC106108376 isoform X3 [Papilio polytes]|uniref:uncharacterized protein LOC106108376 isoform X3 n=1 Tax=Papilio polytes TaxID=76194 RepID=UPI0006766042|nr:PREDICTED: uncharacterized protein LOC106108376 isoform X3 [Papilio polytes]